MSRELGISEGTKAVLHSEKAHSRNNDSDGVQSILYGRVVSIALSVNDPLYSITNILESIQFEPINDVTTDDKSGDKNKTYLYAIKQDSSIRTPLINEIIPLYPAPDINVQNINTQYSQVFYYGNSMSLYGAVEHNAAPDSNTLQNLSQKANTNKVSSYNDSRTGINNNTSATDTIVSKNTIKLGEYFFEQGIKPLSPMEGDVKFQGRAGNSIRLGYGPSSTVSKDLVWSGQIGSPILMIRNGQSKIDSGANIASVFEDINKDGSSIYLMQNQNIELVLGCNNFDSYKQNFDNSGASNVVVSAQQNNSITQSAANTDNINPSDQVVPPISPTAIQGGPSAPQDLNQVPDNENDLNFVQIGEDIQVPLTQGVLLNKYNKNYNFVLSYNSNSNSNISLNKAPAISLSKVNAINTYAGKVNNVPLIGKNGKALLDLISLTEGTMGAGNFNGYDIMVGYNYIPGFTDVNSAPPHPNIAIYCPAYNVKSTASGRYQVIIDTWTAYAGSGTTMSRFNQDYACWKIILNKRRVPTVLIDEIDSDYNIFQQVINIIAQEWASLPITNDPKGLYKQAGNYTFQTLYNYYTQILSKYK